MHICFDRMNGVKGEMYDEEEEKICFVILAACEGNVCTRLLQAAKMTNQKFCFVMQVTLFGLRLWPVKIYTVYLYSLNMQDITFIVHF